MTVLADRIRSEKPPKVIGGALSDDAFKREVELAFVERVVRLSFSVSAKNLNAAKLNKPADLDPKVAAELAAHRSPVFSKLARQLERNVPENATFGKFRGGDR